MVFLPHPSVCAEERRARRIRASDFERSESSSTPAGPSTAGCPAAKRRGRRQQGRLFFGDFLLAKQKKVTCRRATPGQQAQASPDTRLCKRQQDSLPTPTPSPSLAPLGDGGELHLAACAALACTHDCLLGFPQKKPCALLLLRTFVPEFGFSRHSVCAEERRARRIRASDFERSESSSTPAGPSTAGCPAAKRRGRRQQGRLLVFA
jgi:hypothetical protein